MARHDETIPVVEETAFIDKREIETDRVKVHTVVETSEQMVREALSSRNVKVTRVPVDRVVTTVPEIRTENGVTIVPVLEEVLVIEKRLILKEEVHIQQELSQETVEVPITLTEGGFGVKLAAAAMAVPHRPSRAIARGRSEGDVRTYAARAQQIGLREY